MRRESRVIALLAGLLAALSVASCGSGNDESAASGSKADKVVWYTTMNPQYAQDTIAAFNKEHAGVDVQALRLPDSQLTLRINSDLRANTPPDLVSTATPAFFTAGNAKGWFAKLDEQDEPSLAGFPAKAISMGTTADTYYTPIVVMYNTDQVTGDDVPRAWQDLLKPEFKGKIVYVDPRKIPVFMGLADLWRQELGADFLERFGKQDLMIVDSGVPGSEAIASGDKSVLVVTAPNVVSQLKDKGAPVDQVALAPSNYITEQTAVMAKAPHPKAARLFMDFLLSDAGQKALAGADNVAPRPGVTNTKLPDGAVEFDFTKSLGRSDQLSSLLGLQ